MIWVRRVIALPLALIFIISFIVLMVVCRVNATAGNPDFYIDRLREADVYNFVHDDLLPAALDGVSGEEAPETGHDISALKPYILDFTRQALPPEWLQSQAESSIEAVLPYGLGDTEHFAISLPLKDRVEAAAQAAKDMLHREDVSGSFYDTVIDMALDEAYPAAGGLPEPFALSRTELETVVVTVLSEEWALAQVDGAIDDLTPYFTREEEHFKLEVDISGRLDALEPVFADIMARQQTYDYIIENVIAPVVLENAGGIMQSGAGTLLTDEEITEVMKEALPLEWYRAQVDEIVTQIFAYLRGDQDSVTIVIPVADRWPAAADAFGELVDRKLAETWDTLPTCSGSQLVELVADPLGNFPPECRPLGMSYAQISGMIDVVSLVTPLLDTFLPGEFVLTDTQLRQMLGGEGDEDLLARGRELVRNGLTYSDADLRADLGEGYESLEEMREIIAAGLSFSDDDLREAVISAGGGSGEDDWRDFEAVRASIGAGRSWLPVAWLVPLLLLAGIGALCGQNWRSRVIWAASVLAVASAIALILFGPVYSAMAAPVINEALTLGAETTGGVEGILIVKVVEIARNSVESFIGGLTTWAVILLVLAVVAIVVASLWHTIFRNRWE